MTSRMQSPALINPDAMNALLALSASAQGKGVPDKTLHLVELRASQINGCALCVDMHAQQLLDAGVSAQEVISVAAWREAPWFSDGERAALALAEAATRLADRSDPVLDGVWQQVRAHHDEQEIAALLLCVAAINAWNVLNVATAQPADGWRLPARN